MPERRLQGRCVLVVEDEFLIADSLCDELTDSGAIVMGPAPSLKMAFDLLASLDPIDAAVLDINLRGELVYPVAEALLARHVPFVFTTGYDPSAIPERYSRVNCHRKPIDTDQVVEALVTVINSARRFS